MSRPASVEGLLREAAPRALGALVRRFGDFAEAEDAVQEASIAAVRQWPTQGTPENPVGWLVHVACRRMTDSLRSERARRRREGLLAAMEIPGPPGEQRAGRHARADVHVLPSSAHAGLGDRLDAAGRGGLTTAEIASAFLVPEATMAQRIARAKRSITAEHPLRMPGGSEWGARLGRSCACST